MKNTNVTNEDTIAAISTTLGTGGISVIRVSGKNSHKYIKIIFKHTSNLPIEERKLYYGKVYNPKTNEIIDNSLCVFMNSPNTYTGEDIAEIHSHGGYIVPKKILELIISLGARPADPGEFTKRAFLNGKMDLAQAEAVSDIINAQTEKSLKQAESQLEGRLSNKINDLKFRLLDNLAEIEAQVDFPEEDLDPLIKKNLLDSSKIIKKELNILLNSYSTGKIYKEGIYTAILGKPNVGKSSILNNLLSKERSIVSSIPGTTRDFIEEIIDIKGIPLKIVDTAGIRKTSDEIEKIGVKLASQKAVEAEFLLIVLDQSRNIDDDDIEVLNKINGKKYIVLLNKSDLNKKLDTDKISKIVHKDLILEVSAKTGLGFEDLKNKIFSSIIET
ncbi:MAG: tRNA uridine-5-carboxymethylaminomethyl(34) synthesis GTPase MnmE, partial [Candidatus Dadabacteria bacterium]|nr:tRNA uridine-5-carboxymethylaminomethyl(34) synthesis GTPase MnmE [Candidatus Dadabacteria bacterium]NIQ16603.1 tRNA uridine-5-carboxymethylaminomethyl(34) synthesis GTPase MnmE [Candidatus Dadabacteria bacterium]